MELNELIEQRRLKVEAFLNKGLSPYPARVPEHALIVEALEDFNEGKKLVSVAALLLSAPMAKQIFDLRDSTGRFSFILRLILSEKKGFLFIKT